MKLSRTSERVSDDVPVGVSLDWQLLRGALPRSVVRVVMQSPALQRSGTPRLAAQITGCQRCLVLSTAHQPENLPQQTRLVLLRHKTTINNTCGDLVSHIHRYNPWCCGCYDESLGCGFMSVVRGGGVFKCLTLRLIYLKFIIHYEALITLVIATKSSSKLMSITGWELWAGWPKIMHPTQSRLHDSNYN